jgi:hypothetical protein
MNIAGEDQPAASDEHSLHLSCEPGAVRQRTECVVSRNIIIGAQASKADAMRENGDVALLHAGLEGRRVSGIFPGL